MLWTEQLFHIKKPIIAMLHLDPLPGDPRFRYGDSMAAVVAHAKADLAALQDGGVDGRLISNEFSLPYQRHMNFVTPAAMAYVVGCLRGSIRVPFGVDCISDGDATLELAAAVDADFVRGTFSGVYVGDGGLYNNDFSALLRRKAALHLDALKMLYFINPESDRNLDTRPLSEIARSTIFKTHPDGLCISVNAAGQDVDDALIASVKQAAPEVAVLCNTGCRPDTIARKLSLGDVGTYFKEGGPDAYQTMLEGVSQIAPGSDGLITLPYFAGERTPVNDLQARGVLFGLTLTHTRAHLYRSALEGVGYSIAQQIARMRSHENVEINRIIAVGGGTLNPVWMQMIADILGMPICSPEITLGACFGDAMMAALAVKHRGFDSYDSLTRYIREETVYTPNPENHRVYAKYQVLYDRLYPVTAELAHRLASLAEQCIP